MKSSLWGLIFSVIFVVFWINFENDEVELEIQPKKSQSFSDVKAPNLNIFEVLRTKMTSPIQGFDTLTLSGDSYLKSNLTNKDSAKYLFLKVARASFKDSLFLQSRVFYELYIDMFEPLNCEQRLELSRVYSNLGFEDKALNIFAQCLSKKEMTQDDLLWLASLYFKNDSLKSAERVFDLIDDRFELSKESKTLHDELLTKLSKKKILLLE